MLNEAVSINRSICLAETCDKTISVCLIAGNSGDDVTMPANVGSDDPKEGSV